jgi:pimeloyl-ACP methyl ester carboxylesterase
MNTSTPRTPLTPSESFTARMSDGAQIAVRRHGNSSKPRLIISHGNGFAIDGYRVFWEPLLDKYDVVLFDMRNHGQNPPTGADGHNYKQMAADLGTVRDAVAKQWGEKTTVGVFHSMTARAAMKQAVENGWIWDALVLFDPPSVPPRGHPVYELMRGFELRLVEFSANRPDTFASVDALANAYREARASSSWVPQAADDMAQSVLRQLPDGTMKLVCQPELEAAIYLAALTLDLWPAASAFGGPVKLIGADPEAKKSPTARANHALAQEQGYLYEAVSGTGHLLQIEKPEESRAAMLSFLTDLGIA